MRGSQAFSTSPKGLRMSLAMSLTSAQPTPAVSAECGFSAVALETFLVLVPDGPGGELHLHVALVPPQLEDGSLHFPGKLRTLAPLGALTNRYPELAHPPGLVLAERHVSVPDPLDGPLHPCSASVFVFKGLGRDGENCVSPSQARNEHLLPIEWHLQGAQDLPGRLEGLVRGLIRVPAAYDKCWPSAPLCICGAPRCRGGRLLLKGLNPGFELELRRLDIFKCPPPVCHSFWSLCPGLELYPAPAD